MHSRYLLGTRANKTQWRYERQRTDSKTVQNYRAALTMGSCLLQHRALAASASFRAPRTVAEPAHSYHQGRVLIVDHDMRSCACLKLMLLDLGYRSTCTTHSATRALALVGGFAPAIVLLELDLPDMSAYRLAQMMRTHALAHLCRISLIAVAEREAHASGDLARAAGFDGYLTKPIRAPALDQLLLNLQR